MIWARMVAYTGTVNQQLLCGTGRLLLSEGEKVTLAKIAQRLGWKTSEELAAVAKPDTLLAWYRKLVANKFDGSKNVVHLQNE
jgi:putative transposase